MWLGFKIVYLTSGVLYLLKGKFTLHYYWPFHSLKISMLKHRTGNIATYLLTSSGTSLCQRPITSTRRDMWHPLLPGCGLELENIFRFRFRFQRYTLKLHNILMQVHYLWTHANISVTLSQNLTKCRVSFWSSIISLKWAYFLVHCVTGRSPVNL